jgi:hypothetical protein
MINLLLIDALKYTFYTTEWLGSNQFYDLTCHLVSVYCGKSSEMKVSCLNKFISFYKTIHYCSYHLLM